MKEEQEKVLKMRDNSVLVAKRNYGSGCRETHLVLDFESASIAQKTEQCLDIVELYAQS